MTGRAGAKAAARGLERPLPAMPRATARGLNFRPIAASDMRFLADLYAAGRAGEVAPLPWSAEQKAAFLRMQFEAQHAHYMAHYPDAHWLIATIAERPVGRLYLECWPSEVRIIDIALLPDARGMGLGTAMLEDVMALAADEAKGVGIHVEHANRARRLYERLGFRQVADQGVYALMHWEPPAAT